MVKTRYSDSGQLLELFPRITVEINARGLGISVLSVGSTSVLAPPLHATKTYSYRTHDAISTRTQNTNQLR